MTPKKILEIVDDDAGIIRFYVSLNGERDQFQLFVRSELPMHDHQIYSLVQAFLDQTGFKFLRAESKIV